MHNTLFTENATSRMAGLQSSEATCKIKQLDISGGEGQRARDTNGPTALHVPQ